MTTTTLKAFGTTQEITTCECCGREDLKKTIIMDTVDSDGNRDLNIQHFGVVCAAKNSGRTEKEIKEEVKAAEKIQIEDTITKEAERISEFLKKDIDNAPTLCAPAYQSNIEKLAQSYLDEMVSSMAPKNLKKSALNKVKRLVLKKKFSHQTVACYYNITMVDLYCGKISQRTV